MANVLLVPSKNERELGVRIEVSGSPVSLNTKEKGNQDAHLERGQAIFRAVIDGIPDLLTIASYSESQAKNPRKILGSIKGQHSQDATNGFEYRSSVGNDRSMAKIRYPGDGEYELTADWEIKLSRLELSRERGGLTSVEFDAQRILAEPFGMGTGNFAEYVARVHAVDTRVLGGSRFWNRVVEATHRSSNPPLKEDGFFSRNLNFGGAALYTVETSPREGALPDAVINISRKVNGKPAIMTQKLRHLGSAVDQHGELLLFAEVANVPQPGAV